MRRMNSITLFLAAVSALGCDPAVRDYEPDGSGGAGGGSTSSASSASASSSDAASSSASSGGGVFSAVLPAAPDEGRFMWQGTQTHFITELAQPCTGSVAIAVGARAVCYVGSGGALRCAGEIHDQIFGSTFTEVTGVEGVEQILMSQFNDGKSGICVRTRTGKALCMGSTNTHGQFGNGTTNPTSAFTPWGSLENLAALATGTWDMICGLSQDGLATCAGYGVGSTPAPEGTGAKSLWVDTFGKARLDDAEVFRAVNGRADCTVTSEGLKCSGGVVVGTKGEVVDGVYGPGTGGPSQDRYCWLSVQGKVSCQTRNSFDPPPQMLSSPYPMFTQQKVLALAGSRYSSSLCAVYADGSIACTGKNDFGQLGLPPQEVISAETVVQPKGSVDTSCE